MKNEYTERMFLTAVIEKLGAESTEGAYATARIAKMDADNVKRKGKVTKEQAANAALTADIVATFDADTVYTAREVAASFGITSNKASGLLTTAVKAGTLTCVGEVSVKNAEGKTSKVKGYKLATTGGETETDEGSVGSG